MTNTPGTRPTAVASISNQSMAVSLPRTQVKDNDICGPVSIITFQQLVECKTHADVSRMCCRLMDDEGKALRVSTVTSEEADYWSSPSLPHIFPDIRCPRFPARLFSSMSSSIGPSTFITCIAANETTSCILTITFAQSASYHNVVRNEWASHHDCRLGWTAGC